MWPDDAPVSAEGPNRQASVDDGLLLEELAQRPALREPVGWRSLSDAELGVRVMLLLDAIQATPVRVAAGPLEHGTQTTVPQGPAKPSNHGLAFLDPTPDAVQHWGRVGLGLPWLVVVAGIAMTLPVLLWAPMVGGLCVGALVLQVQIVRRWARQRLSEVQSPPSASSVDLNRAAVSLDGPSRVHQRMPAGLLLLAFLGLTALLAAVLLTTLHIKSREPAVAADLMRQQRQQETTPGSTSNLLPRAPVGPGVDQSLQDEPSVDRPTVRKP